MASKMIGALFLVLLLALTQSDGQVLPTPCCRLNCCDGKPECCSPGYGPLIIAEAPSTSPAPAPSTLEAAPTAPPRKISAGASDLGVRRMFANFFGRGN
jgi:hypothetical protein